MVCFLNGSGLSVIHVNVWHSTITMLQLSSYRNSLKKSTRSQKIYICSFKVCYVN